MVGRQASSKLAGTLGDVVGTMTPAVVVSATAAASATGWATAARSVSATGCSTDRRAMVEVTGAVDPSEDGDDDGDEHPTMSITAPASTTRGTRVQERAHTALPQSSPGGNLRNGDQPAAITAAESGRAKARSSRQPSSPRMAQASAESSSVRSSIRWRRAAPA